MAAEHRLVVDTITIIKEYIEPGEIERNQLAYAAGITPRLLSYDENTNAITFERCEPIDDLSPHYTDIFNLILKGVRYDRRLAHADPGPMCSGRKGCNVMLRDGEVVLIDWGEIANEPAGDLSDEMFALDTFMRYWCKAIKRHNVDIIKEFRNMKRYIYETYNISIDDATPYERIAKNKISLQKKEAFDQSKRIEEKLKRYSKGRGTQYRKRTRKRKRKRSRLRKRQCKD